MNARIALAEELDAVVPPGGVRPRGERHPHQQLRKLRQPLALAQQREHQLILQPVELQVGERLSSQGGLQERAAALQLLRREVGRGRWISLTRSAYGEEASPQMLESSASTADNVREGC